MPRAGQVKSSGERLSDRVAIGVLTRTFSRKQIDEVLASTGGVQQRSRLLPSRVVVYFVLAMCLFFRQGYEEVLRLLTQGLPGQRRWEGAWRCRPARRSGKPGRGWASNRFGRCSTGPAGQ